MAVFQSLFSAFFEIAVLVIDLYIWVVIIGAVLSWLIAFDVVNTRNRFVASVGDLCYRLTEPALRRLRRMVPVVGGLDLSPIALIFGLMFIKFFLRHLMVA